MLTLQDIDAVAGRLHDALCERTPIKPLGVSFPGLSAEDAYAIQEAWTAREVAYGRKPAGYKLGLTNRPSQEALGIDRPIYGVLFADARIPDGGRIDRSQLIAPRAEPELAFVLRTSLEGDVTPQEALAAVDYAAPAVEIIDNRVMAVDGETGVKRNALDIIADGGGASGYIVSDRRFDPAAIDLGAIEASVFINGDAQEQGCFANVFGSPENALVELARELARRGRRIEAGDIVLSGAPIRPLPMERGDSLRADFAGLGKITWTMV